MKRPRKTWADRRLKAGARFERTGSGVKRAPLSPPPVTDADVMTRILGLKQRVESERTVEQSRDKYNDKTGLFENKGRKDGRCNRTACQRPIGNHPELARPRPQYVMGPPYTAGEQLFYCRSCHLLFTEDDRRFGDKQRTHLYEEPPGE